MYRFYRAELYKRLQDFLAEDNASYILPTIVVSTVKGSTEVMSINFESIKEIRLFLTEIENYLLKEQGC